MIYSIIWKVVLTVELNNLFDLSGRVCVITGGAGLLGKKHVEATLIGNGIPVLIGRSEDKLVKAVSVLSKNYQGKVIEYFSADITSKKELYKAKEYILNRYGSVDILINNAANNPKVEAASDNMGAIRFTNFPIDTWNQDIAVGLTGALICCQIFGEVMERQRSGVILNISSDYGIRAPDQRIYRKKDLPDEKQAIKPVTYSVVKHGMIGLTKYLATYWGNAGIRCNTLCPSGIYDGQDEEFLSNYVHKIPLGRMSQPDDYIGSVLYMISDASAFMNGATIIVDGGKSIW